MRNIFLIYFFSMAFMLIGKTKEQHKPAIINYTGTLTSLNDRELPLSNIAISGRQQCILVYKGPFNPDTLLTQLCYNPIYYERRINLKDIAEIEVPYPYAKWIYCYSCRRKKDKYLLIRVHWRDTKKEATTYLVSPKRRLTARVDKKGKVSDKQIPFKGIKKITIEKPEK